MPEKKVYSLSQLTQSIENVINQYCNRLVWIRVEIVKLNYYSKTGHCYPTLVEKKNGRVIADLRGNIWNASFQKINNKFRSVLKEELRDDMTVVIQGSVTYHPVHGLALNIIDIDPHYTLGELAREKAESIEKLKKENIFDANKRTSLPQLPKSIAIISVETSKGYQDFVDVIEKNSWGFKIQHLLFPAVLQGERAISTISEQLERIEEHLQAFDAVAIIRGGGGEIGLSCFDNYSLARRIANFPLPVLTGIGHSTNETVSELVSFQSFITPTKIAEFLLQNFQEFALKLQEKENKLLKETDWLLSRQKNSLTETSRLFNSLAQRSFEKSRSVLEKISSTLASESTNSLRQEKENLKGFAKAIQSATIPIREGLQQLGFVEEKIRMLSPENVLKRGFSITRQKGKIITNAEQLKAGELIETHFYRGKVSSRIEKNIKHTENE